MLGFPYIYALRFGVARDISHLPLTILTFPLFPKQTWLGSATIHSLPLGVWQGATTEGHGCTTDAVRQGGNTADSGSNGYWLVNDRAVGMGSTNVV
jgi:hypothetical protein